MADHEVRIKTVDCRGEHGCSSLLRYNLGYPFFTQAKQTPATRCSNEPRRENLLNADGLSGVVLHHPPTATKVVEKRRPRR